MERVKRIDHDKLKRRADKVEKDGYIPEVSPGNVIENSKMMARPLEPSSDPKNGPVSSYSCQRKN